MKAQKISFWWTFHPPQEKQKIVFSTTTAICRIFEII